MINHDWETRLHRGDGCLSFEAGRLRIERCDATALAAKFGTPVYVISEGQLRANYRNIEHVFRKHWPHGTVELLPSLKANYVMALRRILNEEGAGCDVFGSNELYTALRAGVDPSRISVNGSAKTPALLRTAISSGATITLDSESEFQSVRSLVQDMRTMARIRLRIRPDYDELSEQSDFFPDSSIREAAQHYKPGIEPRAALAIGAAALSTPGVSLTGLMTHLGRHSADPEVWAKMARGFGQTVAQLCRAWGGWRPDVLDVGGGLPSSRDPTSPSRRLAEPIETYARRITGSLTTALLDGGIDPANISLAIEPGRSLFADAGLHLSRIIHIKTQNRPEPRTWVEVDTSEMFMPDVLIERASFRPVFAAYGDAVATSRADIVGISCGFDVLASDIAVPAAVPGDVVAFLDTGAYQDAAAANFNVLARPGTVLVNGNRARLIKRHESVEDILARDDPNGPEFEFHPE